MERLDGAAKEVIEAALRKSVPEVTTTTIQAEELSSDVGVADGVAWRLSTNGRIGARIEIEATGDYVFRARVWGKQSGGEPVLMGMYVQGEPVSAVEVWAQAEAPEVDEVVVHLEGGEEVSLRVQYLNDVWDPQRPFESIGDRDLYVDYLELEGPYGVEPGPDSESRAALLTCDPLEIGANACAREILGRVAKKAWRREASDEEIVGLLRIVDGPLSDEGVSQESFEAGLKLALRAVVLSGNFLFRPELPQAEEEHLLSDGELATRLAYFLWSSTPDERLLNLAEQGALQNPVVIESEVQRMLADPRSSALVENFSGQWLQTRKVEEKTPDPSLFEWDEQLAFEMKCETQLMFDETLREQSSALDLIDAPHTYLTARLAEHYGLQAQREASVQEQGEVGDETFVRVDLTGTERAGVLTQGSFLTVTSNPNRTSLVKRGKWVLDQLLCMPPPPPPPDVTSTVGAADAEGTLREQIEAHRASPICASCHQLMDPIGFALERFDAVGKERGEGDGEALDTSGTLFGELPFKNHGELLEILKEQPTVPGCISKKMLTYALGRGVDDTEDACTIQSVSEAFAESGYQLEALIVAIAQSSAFRMRSEAGANERGAQASAVVVEGDEGSTP